MGVAAPLGALWQALLAAMKLLGANWNEGFSCQRPGELPSENWDPSCALVFLMDLFYILWSTCLWAVLSLSHQLLLVGSGMLSVERWLCCRFSLGSFSG